MDSNLRAVQGGPPPDLLVLPAHESLFYGVHERLTALVDWHEVALEKLYDLCATPKRAVDVFPALFKSAITDFSYFPATGEHSLISIVRAKEECWWSRKTKAA